MGQCEGGGGGVNISRCKIQNPGVSRGRGGSPFHGWDDVAVAPWLRGWYCAPEFRENMEEEEEIPQGG